MGRDKYSRSPDRRHRRRSDDSDDDRGSDDEYRRKKEQKKREKELRKREEWEREQRDRGFGDNRGSPYQQPGEFGIQGAPNLPQYPPGQGQVSHPSSGRYGQYVEPQRGYPPPPPPTQQQYGGQQYNQPPQQPYGPLPHTQGHYGAPPAPGYGPPPEASGYDRAPPQSPYGGGYQSSLPPQQPGQYQAYSSYSPAPTSPPVHQGSFQSQQYPPQQPVYQQGGYQIPGPPPGPPPPHGPGYSGGGVLGYSSRPQYETGASTGGDYKPQAHSHAQEQGDGCGTSIFTSTPTKPDSISSNPLDTFTKGLSLSLHNYARTLFPATSSYAAGEAAPEAKTGNRFESFAPIRNGNGAKWYVDGKDYMYAVSIALERARQSIFILDWWLSPELYLRRPPKTNEQYRLDRMLQAAAARGVMINVIVYKEVTQALTLDSRHTKHALEDLHPNICVFRHPDHLPDRDNVIRDTWTKIKSGNYKLGDGLRGIYGFKDDITLYFAHHEKLLLIDNEIAFMGGLDLCFGRFDSNEHPIADAHPSDLNAIIFPGQDYNNARYMDFQHVDKWQENAVSRLELSRMGWTDVAMSLMGPAVEDLRAHFIQRWNFIYDDKYDARGVPRYKRLDDSNLPGGHGYHRRHLKEKVKQHLLEEPQGYYDRPHYQQQQPNEPEGVRLQICRSISKWSHGRAATEHSIANAYIEIISAAKHFVYMENQFFITATSPNQKPILNMIGRAIVDRIIRAHTDAERFRIIVIIPAVPGFAGDLQADAALGTRAIMEFQYRSINRDRGYSILEQLLKVGIDGNEYIRFYNLRSYDRINFAGAKLGEESSGIKYDSAARAHDEQVGGGQGYGRVAQGQYGAPISGAEYSEYQQHAPSLPSNGKWDSVAKCVMLHGGDIRQVPWDGNPDDEIDAFVSEELYVHSKLLIADDRLVLMGSANLNDRSQLGDHDSEIACIIEDPTPLPSRMNGRRFIASHFAATLRRQIFRKHLGLIPAQNFHSVDENMMPIPVPNIYDFDSPEDRLVEDPLSDEFWRFWNQTAKINTDVFARVFHAVPHDSVKNWTDYNNYWTKHFVGPKPVKKDNGNGKKEELKPPVQWGHVVKSEFSPGAQGAREVKEILSAVRGHLVEMPLQFLEQEDIAEEGLGLNALTETLYT